MRARHEERPPAAESAASQTSLTHRIKPWAGVKARKRLAHVGTVRDFRGHLPLLFRGSGNGDVRPAERHAVREDVKRLVESPTEENHREIYPDEIVVHRHHRIRRSHASRIPPVDGTSFRKKTDVRNRSERVYLVAVPLGKAPTQDFRKTTPRFRLDIAAEKHGGGVSVLAIKSPAPLSEHITPGVIFPGHQCFRCKRRIVRNGLTGRLGIQIGPGETQSRRRMFAQQIDLLLQFQRIHPVIIALAISDIFSAASDLHTRTVSAGGVDIDIRPEHPDFLRKTPLILEQDLPGAIR